MLTIKHTHTDNVIITYLDKAENYALKEERSGNMGELSEHVCDVLYSHNFAYADVCSLETGEVLMTIEWT